MWRVVCPLANYGLQQGFSGVFGRGPLLFEFVIVVAKICNDAI